MTQEAKDEAIVALGKAIAAVVGAAFEDLDPDLSAELTKNLMTGEINLLVTVKTPGAEVVGTVTSPTGAFPPFNIFRIHPPAAEVGH
jgi:hypothetical protein